MHTSFSLKTDARLRQSKNTEGNERSSYLVKTIRQFFADKAPSPRKCLSYMAVTHLHLMQRLRLHGALYPVPHMSSYVVVN